MKPVVLVGHAHSCPLHGRGDRNLQLRLSYHPNQGLSEQAEVSASFVLAG